MIDYTKVPRRLIYENREELDDFPIDNATPTVETVFYKALMRCPFVKQIPDTAQMVLDVLNNAKYITTLILIENHPELFLQKYQKIAHGSHEPQGTEQQAATMALVCNYIDFYNSYHWNPIIEEIRSLYEENELAREIFESLITPSDVPMKPYWGNEDFEPCRIDVVVKPGHDISGEDIVLGIDYLIERACGMLDDEVIPRVLSQAKAKMEKLKGKYVPPFSYPFEEMLSSEWNAKIESAISKIEKVASHYNTFQPLQDTTAVEYWRKRYENEVDRLREENAQLMKLQNAHQIVLTNNSNFARVVQAMVSARYFKRADGDETNATEVGNMLLKAFGVSNTWKSVLQKAYSRENPLKTFDELRTAAESYWANRFGLTKEIREKAKK